MSEQVMRAAAALGVELWNDSCVPAELEQAVAQGFVGVTSNPVIVGAAVQKQPELWLPVLDELRARSPAATPDELLWQLVGAVVRRAAGILQPVWERSRGTQGWVCAQVSPKLHSTASMVAHAEELRGLAPNVAIKLPATAEGIAAMRVLAARGVTINATVSFSVAQAIAVAEALGAAPGYVTLMIGRVDDFMKRTYPSAENLDWAGIAVFKRAHGIFLERGYGSRLLAAAYRHPGHFAELVGPGIVQSMPYGFWTELRDVPTRTLERPVDPGIIGELSKLPEFVRAFEPGAMQPAEFVAYGAAQHTLTQFLAGYDDLLKKIGAREPRNPGTTT